jgi:membrane-associated HD superfamily phosphohydrolase
MPSAVRRIANEHHGTTLVAYFYYKAKQQQEVDGEPVIERLFRYQGNLPSSKESAIVMLADSCEAAVRSLNEPSREEIAEMIRRIVQGKIDDGQLKQAPLTLEELDKIERSFLHTFSGLMHERIRYPGMELPG